MLNVASRRFLSSLAIALLALCGVFGVSVARAAPENMRMGMFALWARGPDGADLGGREANLQAWERTLRLPTSSLLALDFYGNETWEEMASRQWVPAYWARRNPDRKLIWSIPLTMKGAPLKEVAEGGRDAEFKIAARAIAAAQPDAVIRIGWEMNTDFFAWAASGKEADYIAAFRRVVGFFRAASPRFTFDWCANWGLNDGPSDLAYPGDDVVDTIGLDVYDITTAKTPPERWRDEVLDTPYGLRWLEQFSARHGKKMSIGEWGVGLHGAPDNPYFVDRMSEWLRAHADRVAFHVYFASAPHDLNSGRFPLSRERFLKHFSVSAPALLP